MKMGFHCTAAIFVKDFDSHVEVSYYKGHYKHEKSLCHVPLPEVEKELIAGKLLQGVAEKNILQDIRQSLDTSFGRKHLTSRKDLLNIKRDFGIMLPSRGSIIQDDEMSVCAWVDKMKIEKDNPVLFYKRQDDAHPTIQNKDFMLVLMTHFQKSIFYRLGADRICVDSTHSISNYNFELVTVLVIDEYEEGIPVAFCISSSVNTVILTHFFQCIKTTMSTSIIPKIFMSDDAVMFKNAWVSVFGPCDHYLLCAWHVDRAWRKKLNSVKKEIREDIYKTLKTLMYELDENNFKNMLSSFCEMLNEDINTKEFYEYFFNNYHSRCEMWAYCFRKGAKINTNMHIENFHRSLKHIYLEGKKTKRVDKVIFELIRLVNDKNFDYYIKTQKGKITKKATQNFKRHRDDKNLQATFEQIKENEWKVISGKNVYNVIKVHSCNDTCIIACRNCILCMKSYICTCHDYMISNFLCIHIHYISINSSQNNNFCSPLNKNSSTISVINSESKIITEVGPSQLECNKVTMGIVYNKLNSLTTMDDVVSHQIKNHLIAIKHLLGVNSEYSFPCHPKIASEPSNKKIL
ncbi:uncharacterized protein LOC129965398 [Argiope bruennichi]|uniref:uncharacterized protein LOC129965398 n=1 Tax=Argiope bruennichi TaxID=94029 RepID=UPI002493DF7E|nr:uncharacterized protein LOC129965398 [Argiope bruennichi]